MYVVTILEEAHEDLRNIVAYIAKENPNAAETLGSELLDRVANASQGSSSIILVSWP
jgi:plasmid stabilization system protein ParE